MGKDYYKILGIERNASEDDVKKAFRKLAHQHHPDKQGGDAAKFKEISEAYSVLGDKNKRAQYDQFGSAGPGFGGAGAGQGFGGFDFSGFGQGGQGFEFDLGDIFGDMFGGAMGGMGNRGGQKKGRDLEVHLTLTFEESVFGVDKKVVLERQAECDRCKGDGGEPGTEKKTCTTCSGKGKINEVRRSILGTFNTTRTCDECHGKGKIPKEKCKICRGSGLHHKKEEITIRIPAGVNDGETMKMTGYGEALAGGKTGDLYIQIRVRPHTFYTKDGLDLRGEIKIKMTTALLGGEYPLQTLDGPISLTIPEGIQHGELLRIKGKGVASERGRRGDILIRVNLEIPHKISKTAKKLIEELKKEGI